MNAFNHDLKDNIDQTERSLAKVWPRISVDKARRIPLSTQDATRFAEKRCWSEARFTMARNWTSTCVSTHDRCTVPNNVELPTRLLDVGGDRVYLCL